MELYNFNLINCNLDLKQSISFLINYYRWISNRNDSEPVIFDFNNDIATVFPTNTTSTSTQMIENYKQNKTIPDPLPIKKIVLADNNPVSFMAVEISDNLYGVESRDLVNQVCNKSRIFPNLYPLNVININYTKMRLFNSWELSLLANPLYKNIFLFDADCDIERIVNYLYKLGLNTDSQKNIFPKFFNFRWYEKFEIDVSSNFSLFPKFNFGNTPEDCNYSLIDYTKGGKLTEIIGSIFMYLWMF